jgi:adenylate cyclase
VIKKEIVYSGDVLNTTSRIQEMCNQFGVDILASKDALKLIENSHSIETIPLGSIQLRGKKQKIEISTLQ